jgi:hypothetical protein
MCLENRVRLRKGTSGDQVVQQARKEDGDEGAPGKEYGGHLFATPGR